MRPIELKIKGINSYREEQVINFNQLTSQGFFGIFGPTGSGKSTILDAITLALYAKLPRGSKNFININETSASVSFRFSITTTETKEYLVERSFRYPGKDRSSTARNTTARLSLLSDVDTEILADKPTDVTRSCTDLLGLSSDDFLRTVVLPQGQFSDFLKLKNQERRGMLQRIFHLERYGIELTRKVAAARQRMDIEVSSSEGQLQAYDDISKEALDNISSELVELKENLEKEELTEKELSEKYQLLNELKELKAEYDSLLYRETDMLSSKKQIEDIETALLAVKQAESIYPLYKDYKVRLKESNQSQKDIDSLLSDEKKLKQQQSCLEQEMEDNQYPKAIKKLADKEDILKQSTILKEKLDDIQKAILAAQERLSKKQKESDSLNEDSLYYEKELIAKNEELDSLLMQQQKCVVDSRYRQCIEDGRLAENTYRTKRDYYTEAKGKLETCRQMLSAKEQQFTQESLLFQQQIKELLTICAEAESIGKQLESEINQCNEGITKQKKEYLLEELSHYIKDGEKCPLCGNIHPSYVFSNKEEALGASLKDKTNELNALKEKQQYVSQTVLLLQASLSGKEKELSSDEIIETSLPADIGTWIEDKKANLSDMLTAFSEQCLKCTSIKASMKEVKDQLKKAKDEVTEFYKALKSLLDNIKTLRKEYDIADFTKEFDLIVEKEKKREEYEEQIKALRLKISELEKSKEDINKRKNSLLQELTKCQAEEKQRVDEKKSLCEQFPDNFNESEDYQSALKTTESEKNILTEKYENWKKSEQEVQASLQKVSGSLQTQENCLKSSQEKQREAYAAYLKELERLGLSPDFDVEKNLMEEDKKQSLLEKVNSYKESLKDIDTQKTYLKGKIKDQTFDEKEWKDLIEALSTSKESLLNYRKKIAVYESQSTDIQKRLAQKDEINAKYQQIIHRRSIIRELEELFKGNAFIEYVAESRLRYIAKEASSILSHISNGNYTLDVNDATEFVIRDNKNGGVLRAADTLSGGEIFITSLSLALALSSSIQLNGSAPLELFFLDEGFGSLDDELLNIVMDSLERIKTDRRSIGIISHVENLKERVPVKLLIEPSQNTGSGSHIRVQYS